MSSGTEFVQRYYDLLAAGDIDGVTALYSDDGEIIRYDGVADTADGIADYLRAFVDRHPGFSLNSIAQFREVDEVLMWDALVDTDNGVLQTVHVMVLTEDGSIRRHIPGFRGYWGK